MKKNFILAIFLFFWVSPIFCQNTISSEIKEVVLFTNQALITRTTTTKVKAGLNEILIETQSFNLDRDSIQAVVYGKGEVYSVQFREVHLKEQPQVNIRELISKLEGFQDRRKSLVNKKEVLDRKNDFLNSFIDFAQSQVPQDLKTQFPKLDNLKKSLNFLDESYDSINKDDEDLSRRIRELDKEIALVKQELSAVRGQGRKTKKVIEILFNSSKAQRIKIEVTYLVYNAYWSPFYKVNVPKGLKDVNLAMFAKIRQKTGEDWENVRLSISNIIPLKGVSLPKLNSWYLNLSMPRVQAEASAYKKRKFFAKAAKSQPMQFRLADRLNREVLYDAEEFSKKADFVSAQAKKLPLSFEYELPQAFSLESKKIEAILPIFSKTLKGEFSYYAIPKISALTFLVCKTSADEEFLSGPLNVHFAGRFIGKTHLSEKKAGEEFNLSLGADRQVKVKREKIKDKVKETFFKKISRQTIIRDVVLKITVENLKSKPVKIKILDNIPVSQTDRIEVKNLQISPEPNKKNYQDREGVNLWNLKLKPKEKKEIIIKFTLTYPKGTFISGL